MKTTVQHDQHALLEWALCHAEQEPRLRCLCVGRQQRNMPRVYLPVSAQVLVVDTAGIAAPHIYNGCWIELKRLRAIGQPATPAQLWWIARLTEEGHYAAVCHGLVEAARKLCWYLHRPDLGEMLLDVRQGA